MNPSPILSFEKQATGPENRTAYNNLKDSIRTNTCKLQELDGALARESITLIEHSELVHIYTERLEGIVGIDPLTNLFDGVFLESKLNGLIKELNYKEGQRKFPVQAIIVFFLDINKFKTLNDKYGHDVGDEALKSVTLRLRQTTRRGDQLFRPHGDEFVILLSINDKNSDTDKIFETIKNKINTDLSVDVDGINVPFTISMGSKVLKRGDNMTAAELLRGADKDMYRDKKTK